MFGKVMLGLGMAVGALGGGGVGGVEISGSAALEARMESCPVVCMPRMCTDDVLLKGTATRLTYVCQSSTSSAAHVQTVYVTVTQETTVTPTTTVSAAKSAHETTGTITEVHTRTVYLTSYVHFAPHSSSKDPESSTKAHETSAEEEKTSTTHVASTSTEYTTVTTNAPSTTDFTGESSATSPSSGELTLPMPTTSDPADTTFSTLKPSGSSLTWGIFPSHPPYGNFSSGTASGTGSISGTVSGTVSGTGTGAVFLMARSYNATAATSTSTGIASVDPHAAMNIMLQNMMHQEGSHPSSSTAPASSSTTHSSSPIAAHAPSTTAHAALATTAKPTDHTTHSTTHPASTSATTKPKSGGDKGAELSFMALFVTVMVAAYII